LKVTADFGVCLETEDGEVWDNDCHGKPHLQIVEGPAEVEVNWDRGLL
jgi:hypothetical protein